MLEYFYTEETKEYTHAGEVFVDPLESKKQGTTIYMFSANATTQEPLEYKDGYAVIWNGSEWEYIEDHRGKIVWKSHEESMEIRELGLIPDGWAVEQPEKPMSVDDYDSAMEAHLLATRVARGYTLREPSPTYDNSPNERWASDAKDWKIFFTTVMEYGLRVQNEYASTGIAPTLEEFKNNLPNIVWSYSEETENNEQ